MLDGADDRRIGLHRLDAPHQKPAEAARLFDLSKHRLRQLLTQPPATAVSADLDFRAQGLDPRGGLGGAWSGGEIVSTAALVALAALSPLAVPAKVSLAQPVSA